MISKVASLANNSERTNETRSKLAFDAKTLSALHRRHFEIDEVIELIRHVMMRLKVDVLKMNSALGSLEASPELRDMEHGMHNYEV